MIFAFYLTYGEFEFEENFYCFPLNIFFSIKCHQQSIEYSVVRKRADSFRTQQIVKSTTTALIQKQIGIIVGSRIRIGTQKKINANRWIPTNAIQKIHSVVHFLTEFLPIWCLVIVSTRVEKINFHNIDVRMDCTSMSRTRIVFRWTQL
jgi:hypothetical protein